MGGSALAVWELVPVLTEQLVSAEPSLYTARGRKGSRSLDRIWTSGGQRHDNEDTPWRHSWRRIADLERFASGIYHTRLFAARCYHSPITSARLDISAVLLISS